MDTSALHADIFGSDDDDDDEYVPPEHAAEDEGAVDSRADAILESARENNLLLGSKKKKESKKKEKKGDKDVGRGGKRKSKPSAEAMAAEGAKPRKRLRKGGEGEAGTSGAAGGDAEDPDEDSVDGDEAIEEGGKGDIQHTLDRLKAKRGGPTWSRDKLMDDVRELQDRMQEAAEADEAAAASDPPAPAVHKVGMLEDVIALLRKKQYHEVMIDMSMLTTLASWLRPMQDGTLVSVMIRKALLTQLLRFEIDETTLGPLRSSGIGKYVKLFSMHKKETLENRKMALSLVEKWSRPIFQTSDKVRAEELPVAEKPLSYDELSNAPRRSEDPNSVGGALNKEGGSQTANHARVPRPMGMDFQMLPASSSEALPSSKYAKESTKAKLQDRILHGKKKSVAQAVQLSVEGRTLDRL